MSKLEVGKTIILKKIPDNLVHGLPDDDQVAIQSIVGKPVTFVGYSFGQAEIEFIDKFGDTHTIWIDPSFLS